VIDTERVLDDPSLVTEDIDQLVSEFLYLRRQTMMLLYDLTPAAWKRTGVHAYRGEVSVLQLARELNQHDLDFLWRVCRMREAAVQPRR
jgi:hypothetical protein